MYFPDSSTHIQQLLSQRIQWMKKLVMSQVSLALIRFWIFSAISDGTDAIVYFVAFGPFYINFTSQNRFALLIRRYSSRFLRGLYQLVKQFNSCLILLKWRLYLS